jgi:hypothetical protein
VITGKDLAAHERARLNGAVLRVLEKEACGQEALLAQVRTLVAGSTRACKESAGCPKLG